jgi:uncharacterized membrane protein
MNKDRLQSFSDGVIAILITIMVLDLHTPQGSSWSALKPLLPVLLSYVLSFVNLGIYWNNHHHLLQAARVVNGAVLWANLMLLFWLSLLPFATGWMGENHFHEIPTAAYGLILLLAGASYFILQNRLVAAQGADSSLRTALGRDFKGKASEVIYAVAIPLAFLDRWIAIAMYVAVAVMWFIPDRRLEPHPAAQLI